MSWTTPRDLETQLTRLWNRGDLLRPLVTCESAFPLRLKFKQPSSTDLTDRFAEVRTWVTELRSMSNIRIQWCEIRHGVQGHQTLPQQIWVDTLDDALTILGKQTEADHYSQVVKLTQSSEPELLPWLGRNPFQAIALAPQWTCLLAVLDWIRRRPRPAIYLRQVDVPGVNTKFIENHRLVLSELLDLVLPAGAIQDDYAGVRLFAQRYGFLDKPIHIRFRILDEKIRLIPNAEHPDIILDSTSFAKMDLSVSRVFITENETNFLAFPAVEDSIVIFGKGYCWESISLAGWLKRCAIFYWGDLDTHGFAILSQLRQHFPHVESFLMDRETLMNHKVHWGTEPDQVSHDLSHLSLAETSLYNDLRDNTIQGNLRLEQERVGFDWVNSGLSKLESSSKLKTGLH